MTTIRPPHASELPRMKALLGENDLPTADFETAGMDWLVAVDEEDRLEGLVGLERFGKTGLLRSLAVAPDARQRGIGSTLVDEVEALALAAEVRNLVLLTQTAETFFASRGYARIDRSAAPSPVQRSAEFRSLCPASATCMIRQLS